MTTRFGGQKNPSGGRLPDVDVKHSLAEFRGCKVLVLLLGGHLERRLHLHAGGTSVNSLADRVKVTPVILFPKNRQVWEKLPWTMFQGILSHTCRLLADQLAPRVGK